MDNVFEEGQIDERKKIVKAMHENGLDLALISQISGLNFQEIEKIINSDENKS